MIEKKVSVSLMYVYHAVLDIRPDGGELFGFGKKNKWPKIV